jgi:hypothetical protein
MQPAQVGWTSYSANNVEKAPDYTRSDEAPFGRIEADISRKPPSQDPLELGLSGPNAPEDRSAG